jgi:hypothetical protein
MSLENKKIDISNLIRCNNIKKLKETLSKTDKRFINDIVSWSITESIYFDNINKEEIMKYLFFEYKHLLNNNDINRVFLHISKFRHLYKDIINYILYNFKEKITDLAIESSLKEASFYNDSAAVKHIMFNYINFNNQDILDKVINYLRFYLLMLERSYIVKIIIIYKNIMSNNLIMQKYKNTLFLA